MRKILFFLLLSFPAQAATVSDIPVIQSTAASIQHKAGQLIIFANAVSDLAANGFTFTVATSTGTITLTTQQKQDLLAYYAQLKTDLSALVTSLP